MLQAASVSMPYDFNWWPQPARRYSWTLPRCSMSHRHLPGAYLSWNIVMLALSLSTVAHVRGDKTADTNIHRSGSAETPGPSGFILYANSKPENAVVTRNMNGAESHTWTIQETESCKSALLVEVWGDASSSSDVEISGYAHFQLCTTLTNETHVINDGQDASTVNGRNPVRLQDEEACSEHLPYQRILGPVPRKATWSVEVSNDGAGARGSYSIRATCVDPTPCPQPVVKVTKPCSAHGTCTRTSGTNARCICDAGWVGEGCQIQAQLLPTDKYIELRPSKSGGSILPGASTGTWALYRVALPDQGAASSPPILRVEMPVRATSLAGTMLPGLCIGLPSTIFTASGRLNPSGLQCVYGTEVAAYAATAQAAFPDDILQGFSLVVPEGSCTGCTATPQSAYCATCNGGQAVYLLVRDVASALAFLRASFPTAADEAPRGEDLCPYACSTHSTSCQENPQGLSSMQIWSACSCMVTSTVVRTPFCQLEASVLPRLKSSAVLSAAHRTSTQKYEPITLAPHASLWWQLAPDAIIPDLSLYLSDYSKDGVGWMNDDDLSITAFAINRGADSTLLPLRAASAASQRCWQTTASKLPVLLVSQENFLVYQPSVTSHPCRPGGAVLLLLENTGDHVLSLYLMVVSAATKPKDIHGSSSSTSSSSDPSQTPVPVAGVALGIALTSLLIIVVALIAAIRRGCLPTLFPRNQPPAAQAADVEMAGDPSSPPPQDTGAIERGSAIRDGLPQALINTFPTHKYTPLLLKQTASRPLDIHTARDTGAEPGAAVTILEPPAAAPRHTSEPSPTNAHQTSAASINDHSIQHPLDDDMQLASANDGTIRDGNYDAASRGVVGHGGATDASGNTGSHDAVQPPAHQEQERHHSLRGGLMRRVTRVLSGGHNGGHTGVSGEDAAAGPPACTICLEEYEEGEELRTLPCMHLFHKGCIDSWMASHITCPVCRMDLCGIVEVQ